jgi:hypothetical protein
MDLIHKQQFIELWNKYFPSAELPLVFYYTDDASRATAPLPTKGSNCIICDLAKARAGTPLCFSLQNVRCGGGKHFLGWVPELRHNFEFFLSCGIPGEMEGERYKKSPALVQEQLKHQPSFNAPGKYIVFKRWDKLDAADEPLVVVFFAPPDVLSGLFTLANYAEAEINSVIAPMGSGCALIVYYPFRELTNPLPHAVLGMFDVSARPCVPAGWLTFAVPWTKFVHMVEDMKESFLITKSWDKVRRRIVEPTGRTDQ